MNQRTKAWRRAGLLALGFVAAASASASAARAEDTTPALDRERIREAQRHYAHEASVGQVIRAALEAYGSGPTHTSQLASRARRRGWMPRIGVDVRHGQARDLSERQTGETGRTNLSTDNELTIEGSLDFDLGQIIFADKEVSLLRQRRALRRERRQLVERVVRLYYERRRLQLERDLLDQNDIAHMVRIAEIEALLNSFTNGAFNRIMEGK
jgi:outer membrane protein TolC